MKKLLALTLFVPTFLMSMEGNEKHKEPAPMNVVQINAGPVKDLCFIQKDNQPYLLTYDGQTPMVLKIWDFDGTQKYTWKIDNGPPGGKGFLTPNNDGTKILCAQLYEEFKRYNGFEYTIDYWITNEFPLHEKPKKMSYDQSQDNTMAFVIGDKTHYYNLKRKVIVHDDEKNEDHEETMLAWSMPVAYQSISPNGSFGVNAENDQKKLTIEAIIDRKKISTIELDYQLSLLAWNNDSKHIAVTTAEKAALIKYYDTTDGKIEQSYTKRYLQSLLSMIFDRTGKYIIGGGSDGTVNVWNVKTADLLQVLGGNSGLVMHLALSPENDYLASSDTGNNTLLRPINFEQLKEKIKKEKEEEEVNEWIDRSFISLEDQKNKLT